MARPVGASPGRPSAPPPLDAWRARRHLNRLGCHPRGDGWAAQARYAESPPMLRVFDVRVPCIGDSITAVREDGAWWFRSSTGERLARCHDPRSAVASIERLLTPWINTALGRVAEPER